MRNHETDLKLLASAFYENLTISQCEYGGIGLDCKRPFGNSDADADILEIIGWDMEGDDGEDKCYSSEQRAYASSLYNDSLIPYLRSKWNTTN